LLSTNWGEMSCDLPPKPSPSPDENPVPVPPGEPPSLTFTSTELLQGHREVLIRHGEETYRLRLTRNDKLILHK
jgi:hemin uptake protein HemP